MLPTSPNKGEGLQQSASAHCVVAPSSKTNSPTSPSFSHCEMEDSSTKNNKGESLQHHTFALCVVDFTLESNSLNSPAFSHCEIADSSTKDLLRAATSSPSDLAKHNTRAVSDDNTQWLSGRLGASVPQYTLVSSEVSRPRNTPKADKFDRLHQSARLLASPNPPKPFPKADFKSIMFKKLPLGRPLKSIVRLVEDFPGYVNFREKIFSNEKRVFIHFSEPEDAQHAIEWLYRDFAKGNGKDVAPALPEGSARKCWQAEFDSWKACTTKPPSNGQNNNKIHDLGDIGGPLVKQELDDIDTIYHGELWQQRAIRIVVEELQNLEKNFSKVLRLRPLFLTAEDLAKEDDELQDQRDGYFMAIIKIEEVFEQIEVINKGFWFHPKLSGELLKLFKEIKPLRHGIVHNVGTSKHRLMDFKPLHRFLNTNGPLDGMYAAFVNMRHTWSREMVDGIKSSDRAGLQSTKDFLEQMEPFLLSKDIGARKDM